MTFEYLITPFIAWFIAGSLKFLINSIKAKQLAFGLVGYGGMPSNHTSIVTSIASLIAFNEGIHSPSFGVAIALTFIVMLDANSLRRQVGKHAEAINKLSDAAELRERMGHTKAELLGGVVTGTLVGYLVSLV